MTEGQATAAANEKKFARTIVIALDSSPSSENAFEWACSNFIRPNDNDLIVLATVREPVLVPGAYGKHIIIIFEFIFEYNQTGLGYMDFGDYIAEAEEQSRLKAHALVKRYGQKILQRFNLPAASGPDAKLTVKGIVMRGDPRDELVRKTQELNAVALVLGSRGLGAFKRAFLGR